MNASDLARLGLAKRAYKAAQPAAAEVQTGVRRARLSLRRNRPRRTWFSKGLVMVVLAVGSLAYAKPQAWGELVERVMSRSEPPLRAGAVGAGVAAVPRTALQLNAGKAQAARAVQPAAHASSSDELGSGGSARERDSAKNVAGAQPPSRKPPTAEGAAGRVPVAARTEIPVKPAPLASVSKWGRVGQALAQGDEATALSALSELSQSDDQRTRDKADLGRAQLFMAHGDSDKACAIARSLTHRRAGSRIERQAQLLLKSCR